MERGNFGKRHDRTGEVNMSNAGLLMTITRYDGYGDIQVTFENGLVRDHMTYDAFKKRSIAEHYDGRHDRKLAKLHDKKVGTRYKMACGQECECIEYRNKWDADFRFEDGSVIAHTPWRNFEKKTLTNPKAHADSRTKTCRASRLHEKRRMNCGAILEIIRYGNAKDIDVRNTETGEILEHKTYQNFQNRQIKTGAP